jgi:phosphatidylinositol alpha 1,6-mannosyltransferase
MAKHLLRTFTNGRAVTMDRVLGHQGARSSGSPKRSQIKRVAVLVESFFPKVAEEAELADVTLRYLQNSGREVLVVTPDMAPVQLGSCCDAHSAFSLLGVPETRAALPNFSIKHALDHFQPDLIHLFNPAVISAPGMWSGRSQRIPVIANYQAPAASPKSWLRSIHNGCQLTLVPSNFALNQLQDQKYERLRVWQSGVDTKRYNPVHRSESWRERLLQGRNPDSLLCLYVGNLTDEKHISLLFNLAQLPDIALTIVGDVREETEYLFAGTETLFTGDLHGEALAKTYASSDVFVSLATSEQTVQEAMASGLPAIVLNKGGITDLVQDGVTGYLCPEDPQAFAAAVQILRNNTELREDMAQRARQASAQYSWPLVMAQLEAYYREAVELNENLR